MLITSGQICCMDFFLVTFSSLSIHSELWSVEQLIWCFWTAWIEHNIEKYLHPCGIRSAKDRERSIPILVSSITHTHARIHTETQLRWIVESLLYNMLKLSCSHHWEFSTHHHCTCPIWHCNVYKRGRRIVILSFACLKIAWLMFSISVLYVNPHTTVFCSFRCLHLLLYNNFVFNKIVLPLVLPCRYYHRQQQ